MIDLFLGFINDFIKVFNNYAATNQVVAGAMSLWGLGVLSYLGRNIPMKLWTIVLKQTTTTMVLMSSSPTFYNFQTWFYKLGYANRARAIKVSSGRWGDDDAVKSIGYGSHYFWYKFMPFKINMTKIDNTNNVMERDELTITVLGRSHYFFNKLFDEIKKSAMTEEKVRVFKFATDYWRSVNGQKKRNVDTVFLDKKIKADILGHIDNFIAKEQWYVDNGLSYQTGILLYGVPGCGKTSLVKAIASKYKKPIYVLNASMLHYIDAAILELPDNSLLLIEDIDSDVALHSRETPPLEAAGKPTVSTNKSYSFTNISDVLNALDGIMSTHGRILIATTNHVEKLDAALLRNGRFDLKVEMGYADNFIVGEFFRRYYPNFVIDPDFRIAEKIPASKIQYLILKNLENPEKVIGLLGKRIEEVNANGSI
jgi:hypothetical protein